MAERYDTAIIGGGIVGLATARALTEARPGMAVAVLEAAPTVGSHQSGHNSGVLHSGLYYQPGSLKADLCVRGRRMMVEFCRSHDVDFDVCGKLVMATSETEVARLAQLEERGRANGLSGLRLLGPGEWDEIEPHAHGLAALWVPEAGVTDFSAVCRALAQRSKFEVRTSWPVKSIRRVGGRWELGNGAEAVVADRVIACAGLQADRLAAMAGIEPPVRIVPFRGEYRRLAGESEKLVRHLIYPVPDPAFPFLGVHFTRRIDGTVEVGPNAVPAIGRHHYRGTSPDIGEFVRSLATPGVVRLARRYLTTGVAEIARSRSTRLYARSARRLLPSMRTADLAAGGAGVRAQAVTPEGRLLDDFCVVESDGFMSVLNAPSPAATASLAIGEYLVARLAG